MSRARAYAQLLRLPNVFTALADILLGAAAVGWGGGRWAALALLLAASACLYCGGMVWNDFFDVEQDRRERPFRPIPSGRIPRRTAAWLGLGLLVGGVLCAAAAGVGGGPSLSSALGLAAAILLYDGWLKRTWAGPLGMGACRFLNVLLGLSLAGPPPEWGWHLAAVVGLYIVGVTWFARTEARVSSAPALRAAAVLMLSALVLALALPTWFEPGVCSSLFPYLLVGLGFVVGLPAAQAIAQPTPRHVQTAVKRAIFGLVGLDAVLATALVGWPGLALLLLLIPAVWLGKWIYST